MKSTRAALRLLFVSSALAMTLGASPSSGAFQSPRQVVEAKFAAVNRHAIGEIIQSYSEDAVLSASDFCAPRHGRSDVERTYRAIFANVPDIQANIVEMVEEGDRVAVRVVLSSSEPGRSFELPLMNFFTVRDGLIVRDDGVFDNRGRPCQN